MNVIKVTAGCARALFSPNSVQAAGVSCTRLFSGQARTPPTQLRSILKAKLMWRESRMTSAIRTIPTRVFRRQRAQCFREQAFNHTTSPANFNQGSAFVSVFNAAGAGLLYSSLYGGLGSTAAGSDGQPGNNGETYGAGVAVDASGNFYFAGTSSSNQLPVTSGAFQRYSGG